jgi:hypothetical protein
MRLTIALAFCCAAAAVARADEQSELQQALPQDPSQSQAVNAAMLQALQKNGAVSPDLIQGIEKAMGAGGTDLLKTINQGTKDASSQDEAAQTPEEPAPSGPMSLADAQTNFQTVVEAKLAAETVKGSWSYQESESGKTWPLSYVKTDASSLVEVSSNVFSGCVLFRRKSPPADVDVDFTVDFSGTHWAVTGTKLHSVALRKRSR